jgi:hypothetical protein
VKTKGRQAVSDSDSSDAEPLHILKGVAIPKQKLKSTPSSVAKVQKKPAKRAASSDSDSSDAPVKAPKSKVVKKPAKPVVESSDSDDTPPRSNKKPVAVVKKPVLKGKAKKPETSSSDESVEAPKAVKKVS